MKKILLFALAIVLVLSCAVSSFTAMADEEETPVEVADISIEFDDTQVSSHPQGGCSLEALIDGEKLENCNAFSTNGVVLVCNKACETAGTYPTYSFIIELDDEAEIRGLTVSYYLDVMSMIGLCDDKMVTVEVSDDGEDFTLVNDFAVENLTTPKNGAAFTYADEEQTTCTQKVVADLAIEFEDAVEGSFVKVTFQFGDSPSWYAGNKVVYEWMGFTEIAVDAVETSGGLELPEDADIWEVFDDSMKTVVDFETGTFQTQGDGAYTDPSYELMYVIEDGIFNFYVKTDFAVLGTAEYNGNGKGTFVRIWFNNNVGTEATNAQVYTHFADFKYNGTEFVTDGFKTNTSLTTNSAGAFAEIADCTIETTLLKDDKVALQVSFPYEQIVGNGDFEFFFNLANGEDTVSGITNNALLYPTVTFETDPKTAFPYSAWDSNAIKYEASSEPLPYEDGYAVPADGDIPVQLIDSVAYEGVVGFHSAGTTFSGAWRCAVLFEKVSERIYKVKSVYASSGTGINVEIGEDEFLLECNCGNDWPALFASAQGTEWYYSDSNGQGVSYSECPNFATAYVQASFDVIPTLEVGDEYVVYGFDPDNAVASMNYAIDSEYKYATDADTYECYSFIRPYDGESEVDPIPEESSEEESSEGSSPSTGDAGFAALGLVAVIALAGAVVASKRK